MADSVETRLVVLERRADSVERALEGIQRSTAEISANLSAIVRLEERHAQTNQALERAFATLKAHGSRLDGIEREMPTLRLVQKWVLGGVGSIIAAAGSAAVWLGGGK